MNSAAFLGEKRVLCLVKFEWFPVGIATALLFWNISFSELNSNCLEIAYWSTFDAYRSFSTCASRLVWINFHTKVMLKNLSVGVEDV